MMKCSMYIVGVLMSLVLCDCAMAQQYSALWGKDGELWSPTSRLPDFSYAGYHFGEDPLPTPEVVANVKTFGAKGDGKADDTAAFKKAIDATDKGAILIPEGRYLLSDILWIKKPNIVLRGEGPGKTILHYTIEMEDVRPNMSATTSGRATSGYSWSGGFLWVKGGVSKKLIAPIVSEAKRGDKTITLEKASRLTVGQRVVVELKDDEKKTLLAHLYSNDSGDVSKINKPIKVRLISRVAAVRGKTITLERPFRWDIRKAWRPTLRTFEPSVREVGIEELAISFPSKPYNGHFTERGMNGIAMNGVSDCWIRNVKITNCDSGVFLTGTFSTIDGLVIDGSRKPKKGDTGHHGVMLGRDCLLHRFDFQTKFIHDITFSNQQTGNVAKNGKGVNLSFDHHKRAPYENLICNVDVGIGSQVWRSGGGKSLGKHCGARGTFWCIHSKNDISAPPVKFGPKSINIVGVKARAKSTTDQTGKWFEAIPPTDLHPADIHAAQLKKRLAESANQQ